VRPCSFPGYERLTTPSIELIVATPTTRFTG
jgi:hypothetical protein